MEQAVGVPLEVEKTTVGLHLIGDLHGCSAEGRLFHDAASLREHCLALVKAAGLAAVGECFHQFGEGGGVTGVVMLAESHLSVHTWPERRYVAVDVYVCNYTTDNRAKARQLFDGLLDTFRPANPRIHEVDRDQGDVLEPSRYLVEPLNDDYGYYLRVGQTLEQGRTRYQQLELLDTPMFGRVLRLDGIFQTSEQEEFFYHENIVHIPAITHAAPRCALVIGGGDGGAAEELLKHNCMERVVVAELDEEVVEAARRHLGAIHRGAFGDPRLELRITDGRTYVEETADRYDLIILDLTDPSGPSQALYSREFYLACRGILNPGGIVALHVESPISRPGGYNRIVKTLLAAFPVVRPYLVYIPLYGTWWGMAVASEGADPLVFSEEQVDRRIAERGLTHLQFYNGATHRAVFALPNFVRDILAQPAEPITANGAPVEEEIGLNPSRRLVLAER